MPDWLLTDFQLRRFAVRVGSPAVPTIGQAKLDLRAIPVSRRNTFGEGVDLVRHELAHDLHRSPGPAKRIAG